MRCATAFLLAAVVSASSACSPANGPASTNSDESSLASSIPKASGASPPRPKVGDPCSPAVVGARGFPGGVKETSGLGNALVCSPQGSGPPTWAELEFASPITRFVTFGPEILFTGESSTESNVVSGKQWIGLPLDPAAQCVEEQSQIESSGLIGTPTAATSATGQPLSFWTVPNLFNLSLKGYCFWFQVS